MQGFCEKHEADLLTHTSNYICDFLYLQLACKKFVGTDGADRRKVLLEGIQSFLRTERSSCGFDCY